MDNKKIKKIICKNWKENNCKFMNNSNLCSFAHGKDDIIKNKCLNGIYCWDEECNYGHPKNWNPYENKKDCFICSKGYCNKENKKYNHIVEEKEEIKKDISEIPKNEEFPELIKSKYINKEYKYSDVLTSNIKNILNIKENNDLENQIIDVKKELQNKYKDLIKTDNWAEITNIEDEIDKIRLKYEKLNNLNKTINNIFNDESLNLDVIFNNDNNDNNNIEEKNETPEINLTINGINIDDSINSESIIEIISENNTDFLIKNMEKEFKSYNKKIKTIINNDIKNDNLKVLLMNNLNEIELMINLFKNNYKDIIKII